MPKTDPATPDGKLAGIVPRVDGGVIRRTEHQHGGMGEGSMQGGALGKLREKGETCKEGTVQAVTLPARGFGIWNYETLRGGEVSHSTRGQPILGSIEIEESIGKGTVRAVTLPPKARVFNVPAIEVRVSGGVVGSSLFIPVIINQVAVQAIVSAAAQLTNVSLEIAEQMQDAHYTGWKVKLGNAEKFQLVSKFSRDCLKPQATSRVKTHPLKGIG